MKEINKTNLVAITKDEVRALIKGLRAKDAEWDEMYGNEYKHANPDIPVLEKFLENMTQETVIVKVPELPTALMWLRDYEYDAKKLDKEDKAICDSIYTKIHKAVLINGHTSISTPRSRATTTAFLNQWDLIEEAFELGTKNECCHYDRDYYTIWYPNRDQCKQLYHLLTHYLMIHPTAPVQAQSMRKKVYNIVKYLNKQDGIFGEPDMSIGGHREG